MALFEGVASIAFMARTGWNMIHHGTISINSTSISTRIFALVLGAGLVTRTIRVQYTFRPADGVRIADQIGRAGAFALSVIADVRYRVGAARTGPARIYWFRRRNVRYIWFIWSLDTRREGVTVVAIGAGADGIVVDHVTLGVDTTHTGTGRHTR